MLIKIPGIDPILLQNLKDQTSKPVVRGSREIRITDKEEGRKGREWFQEGTREELEEFLDEINQGLEKQGHPLRFFLVELKGKWLVEVRSIKEGKVLRQLTLAAAKRIFGKAVENRGLVLDEKI